MTSYEIIQVMLTCTKVMTYKKCFPTTQKEATEVLIKAGTKLGMVKGKCKTLRERKISILLCELKNARTQDTWNSKNILRDPWFLKGHSPPLQLHLKHSTWKKLNENVNKHCFLTNNLVLWACSAWREIHVDNSTASKPNNDKLSTLISLQTTQQIDYQ